jgi:hypothetical protein
VKFRREPLRDCGSFRHTRLVEKAPAHRAGAARSLLLAGAVEHIIGCALCLGGGVNQKLAIIAKLLGRRDMAYY